MSHFVKIRTQLRERTLLLEALRALGLVFEEGVDLPVMGDRRAPESAEIVVHAGPGADIGLRRAREVYEVVADWNRIEQRTPLRRKAFLEDLAQRYACCVVKAQAEQESWIVEEETLATGEVVFTLRERG